MLAAKHTHANVLAIATGVVLAVLLLLGWRVEGGIAPAPAEVELVTASSDDIAVTPSGETTVVARLSPSPGRGAPVREIGVRNATGSATQVAVSATFGSSELAEALRIRLVAGGTEIFSGPLGGLDDGSGVFALESGEETTLAVHAWVPEGAPLEAWAGRSDSVRIQLEGRG
jgi:hypothetical protein